MPFLVFQTGLLSAFLEQQLLAFSVKKLAETKDSIKFASYGARLSLFPQTRGVKAFFPSCKWRKKSVMKKGVLLVFASCNVGLRYGVGKGALQIVKVQE